MLNKIEISQNPQNKVYLKSVKRELIGYRWPNGGRTDGNTCRRLQLFVRLFLFFGGETLQNYDPHFLLVEFIFLEHTENKESKKKF